MARTALHSDDIKIEQKPDISDDPAMRTGDIVVAHQLPSKDYADELAFNEEPVTIRLNPSSDKNASSHYPVWVNGKGCEIFQNGRWMECAYLPVSRNVTIKRKYLEVIIRAKIDSLHTEVSEPESETPRNNVQRFTSPVHSFDIIEDKNPRGSAWIMELRRRNF